MSADEIMGETNEFKILDMLLSNNITITKRPSKYDVIDFYYETDDIFFEIELKSRRNTLKDYKTTILAKNKINYYIKNKNNKIYKPKQSVFFIIFGFQKDENRKEYEFYYIQYLKNDFSTFETWQNPYENDKPYFLIPVEMLKPIDKLINILLNYKMST